MQDYHFTFEPGEITLRQPYVSKEMVLERLKDLIEENYKEIRDPMFYSNALAYGLRSLNILCQAYTGRTVFGLVQERLIIEAERLLVGTGMNTKLIAFELCFYDPAYFCKFFKQMRGMTPGEYRRCMTIRASL